MVQRAVIIKTQRRKEMNRLEQKEKGVVPMYLTEDEPQCFEGTPAPSNKDR